jgi:hypothetical protein
MYTIPKSIISKAEDNGVQYYCVYSHNVDKFELIRVGLDESRQLKLKSCTVTPRSLDEYLMLHRIPLGERTVCNDSIRHRNMLRNHFTLNPQGDTLSIHAPLTRELNNFTLVQHQLAMELYNVGCNSYLAQNPPPSNPPSHS